MPIRWFDYHLERLHTDISDALKKVQHYNDDIWDPKLQEVVKLLEDADKTFVAMIGVNDNMKQMVDEAITNLKRLK